MKRMFCFSLCVAALMAASVRAQAPSPVGSWDITVESPRGPSKSLLVIKQDGDKLAGTIKGQRGERPLSSVTVKGDEITFALTVNAQGQELVITYKGKVAKDAMSGEADFGGMASGAWSAVPHKEDAGAAAAAPPAGASGTGGGGANISGVWKFTVETQMGTGTPTFTLKQEGDKVTGTYEGQLGKAPVTGTVKGDDVTLTIKVSPQGEEITVTYSGKLSGGNAMSGKASFGNLGEGTFSAKKQ